MKLRAVKKRVKKLVPAIKSSEPFTGQYLNGFPYKPVMKNFEIIDTEDRLKVLHNEMMEISEFAFDTETNSLEVRGGNPDFKCVCLTISWGENNNYYIPLNHDREEDLDRNIPYPIFLKWMKPVFERPDVKIIGHNLKFDEHVLKRLGIDFVTDDYFDTMLASWLCNENEPNGLKENSQIKLHIEQEHFKEAVASVPNEIKKQFGLKANSKATYNLVTIKDGSPYALADSFYTYMLYLGFVDELEKIGMSKIYQTMYVPFLKILYEMEERGVTVDKDKLVKMGQDMDKDLANLTYKIYELSGIEFNIGSSQQKAEILFGWRKPNVLFSSLKDGKKRDKFIESYKKNNGGKYPSSDTVVSVANVNENIIDKSFKFKINSFTDSGSPATDNDAIWRISQMHYTSKRKKQGVEMCKLMLDYSKLDKLKTAFVDGIIDKIDENSKVHPSFNQIGTDSGRLSCSSPNLQQLPKADEEDKYQIRSVFIGSEYYKSKETGMCFDTLEDLRMAEPEADFEKKRKKILTLDYHNLEMVCLTYFSKDKNLSTMFANDDDAHGSTAVNMFNLDCTPVECKKKYPHLRQAAKTINFLLMYGGGAKLLYERLGADHSSPINLGDESYLKEYHCHDGVEVAQSFIDRYFESYSGVAKFIAGQKRYAHKHGFVYTILGRKRHLPEINSRDRVKSSYCERLAVNSAVQGTAADITINAQCRVAKEKRLKEMLCYMLIQIHDEICFEIPEEYLEEAIKIVKHDMEHPFGEAENRQVPYLRADEGFGNNYQEAK